MGQPHVLRPARRRHADRWWGRDALYGRAETDTFALEVLQHNRVKGIIRFGDEVLTVNDGSWTLDVSTLTEDSFMF